MEAEHLERIACPACGGAGGGPFGRAGSAWDAEDYVCPRCEGVGAIMLEDVMVQSPRSPHPTRGIVKTNPSPDADAGTTEQKKRKASA